ncbi:MAG: ZIP family metal transporter [Acidobacteriota bacterium]
MTTKNEKKKAPVALPGGWKVPLWVTGVIPVVLVGLLLVLFFTKGPIGIFREAFPPVEELTVERVSFPEAGVVYVDVVNGGPEPVTIAQVAVDDAMWAYTLDADKEIPRLGRTRLRLNYPWVYGEPHEVKVVTSTGLVFIGRAEVAVTTPRPDARYLSTFALLGIYAGLIPVFLGLLWFPFLRRLAPVWVEFFLSLTVGLLLFIGIEAVNEAVETAGMLPGAYQGLLLVFVGIAAAFLGLIAVGQWLRKSAKETSGLTTAYLIATGIGLHNLGEGLAIGSAYALGAIALGTFFVVGFLLHNTTEGLAIIAPVARQPQISRWHFVWLGLLAGAPTILGAWIGGFTYSPIWSTFFLAFGAGAIFQIVWVLVRQSIGTDSIFSLRNSVGLFLGIIIMYATELLVTV